MSRSTRFAMILSGIWRAQSAEANVDSLFIANEDFPGTKNGHTFDDSLVNTYLELTGALTVSYVKIVVLKLDDNVVDTYLVCKSWCLLPSVNRSL